MKDKLEKSDVSTDNLKPAIERGVYLRALRYQEVIERGIQTKSELGAQLEGAASGSDKPPESVSDLFPETANIIKEVEKELDTFITDPHNSEKLKAFITESAYKDSINADKKILEEAKKAAEKAKPNVAGAPAEPATPAAAGGGRRRTHRKKSKKSRRRRSKVPRSA